MESLSSLIKSYQVPKDNTSKIVEVTEWDKAKLPFNDLPNNYTEVVKAVYAKRPKDVTKRKLRCGFEIEVNLKPIHGFETILHIIEHQEKGVIRAWYLMFDNVKNNCYMRDLLKNPTL